MEEKRYCVNCGGELTKDKHGDWVHINGDKICYPDKVANPKPLLCMAFMEIYNIYTVPHRRDATDKYLNENYNSYNSLKSHVKCELERGHTGNHFAQYGNMSIYW